MTSRIETALRPTSSGHSIIRNPPTQQPLWALELTTRHLKSDLLPVETDADFDEPGQSLGLWVPSEMNER
jgi:hypothetical protein